MFKGAALKVAMAGRDGGGAEPVCLPHGEVIPDYCMQVQLDSSLNSDGIAVGKNDFPSLLGFDTQPFPFVGTFTLTWIRIEVSEGFVYCKRNVDFFFAV